MLAEVTELQSQMEKILENPDLLSIRGDQPTGVDNIQEEDGKSPFTKAAGVNESMRENQEEFSGADDINPNCSASHSPFVRTFF